MLVCVIKTIEGHVLCDYVISDFGINKKVGTPNWVLFAEVCLSISDQTRMQGFSNTNEVELVTLSTQTDTFETFTPATGAHNIDH